MSDFSNQIASLENSLNYKFKNLDLLKEALSHPSLKQHDNSALDYERLELLGDSILGFLITEMIFSNFALYEEGNIAKIKAYAVSRETIVKVAEPLNLSEYIIMTPGEEKSGGKTNHNNIENVMEALLAAIYLDSDIMQVKGIVHALWFKYIENVNFSEVDPKSSLQEWGQQKNHSTPSYEVIEKKGPVHAPIFTVQVTVANHKQIATGKSIKEAEKEAARLMLHTLKASI
jgi:ribonuclease-3